MTKRRQQRLEKTRNKKCKKRNTRKMSNEVCTPSQQYRRERELTKKKWEKQIKRKEKTIGKLKNNAIKKVLRGVQKRRTRRKQEMYIKKKETLPNDSKRYWYEGRKKKGGNIEIGLCVSTKTRSSEDSKRITGRQRRIYTEEKLQSQKAITLKLH